jgi:hypothetical protein
MTDHDDAELIRLSSEFEDALARSDAIEDDGLLSAASTEQARIAM